jgi:hypothetical protein
MMRKILGFGGVIALLTVVVPARADDDAKLREIVSKAVKAHGGADNLKKLPASVTKTKGKFYGLGDAIDYTGETAIQLPDRIRSEVAGTANGQDFKFLQIVAGDKGWIRFGDNTEEMSKEMIAEAKEQLNAAAIAHLTVLTGKEYKLSTLGDVKVGGQEALGVRVEREGFRPVSLFFDKGNGMLVKSETRGKDLMRGGEEYTSETFYKDYKKVDGLMVPHKLTIKRDGKDFVESETTDVKPSEKLDDNVFAKP